MSDPQRCPSQISVRSAGVRRSGRLRQGLLALLLTCGLAAVFLGGCGLLKPGPPPDPLAPYRPALREGFSLSPAQIEALPVYNISVRVHPGQQAYTGTVVVSIPITGSIPQDELYFRLYPNLRQFDGSMRVTGARLNGENINFANTSDGIGVRLVPPSPLKTSSRAEVELTYTGKYSRHSQGYYTIFGVSGDVLSLTNFYPILAGRRGVGWALDVADPQGDVGFHDAALYRVSATLPVGEVIVASGVAVGAEPAGDGWMTVHYVQGPAREFTLVLSPSFRFEEAQAYGTTVRSFYLPEDAEAGHSALYTAVAALEIYSDRFGPYPYRDMSVVEAPLTFHGMEFPGLSLIGDMTYEKYMQDLEMRVAHEVAHQWWYNQVGSDQVNSPWLDEGLTEFSMYFYFGDRYGISVADRLRLSRWATPVQMAADAGKELPIGLPVKSYATDQYETMIYARGALFFAALRDEIGSEAFDRLIRTYLATYAWRIATPEDFRALAEQVSGQDLSALFAHWLEGTS
jgi:hypothetical protein